MKLNDFLAISLSLSPLIGSGLSGPHVDGLVISTLMKFSFGSRCEKKLLYWLNDPNFWPPIGESMDNLLTKIFWQLSVWIPPMIRKFQSVWETLPIPSSAQQMEGPDQIKKTKEEEKNENHPYLELWWSWPIPQGFIHDLNFYCIYSIDECFFEFEVMVALQKWSCGL